MVDTWEEWTDRVRKQVLAETLPDWRLVDQAVGDESEYVSDPSTASQSTATDMTDPSQSTLAAYHESDEVSPANPLFLPHASEIDRDYDVGAVAERPPHRLDR